MRNAFLALIFMTALQGRAELPPFSTSLHIESILKAQNKRPRWDDLLLRLDSQGKLKVLSYASASGAAVGALSGIKAEAFGMPEQRLPESPLELPQAPHLDSIYGAAAGAALGGLLGASHLVFADSDISNTLRVDPKNPNGLRRHLIRLLPKIRAQGLCLALNASF